MLHLEDLRRESLAAPECGGLNMSKQIQPILISDRDCAAMLSCSRATFWRRVKDGTVPKPIKFGGLTRWPVEEINTLIAGLKEGS